MTSEYSSEHHVQCSCFFPLYNKTLLIKLQLHCNAGRQNYWFIFRLYPASPLVSPFQAETCFEWCAEANGRGPTKRISGSWVTSVPVWQWIASASCPLVQNKKCGKPGKVQLLDGLFAGAWNLCMWETMCVSFLHFNPPVDRGKSARPSRGHIWTASQRRTSKSSQAYAPLPGSKRGGLWVGVEAVLQSASVQVQAIQAVILVLTNSWIPSGMIMFKCKSGKWSLPFPLQAVHFGYNSCSCQSPCTQVLEA